MHVVFLYYAVFTQHFTIIPYVGTELVCSLISVWNKLPVAVIDFITLYICH